MADEIDPKAPLFFLSYAHVAEGHEQYGRPQERNQLVIEFFDHLSENVAYLVSRPAGADPGYLDRSIAGGAHWTRELLEAIGTCQIFVALLSAPYFTSPWCGKEWHAFSQRKVISKASGKSDNQTAIIPVVWAPVPIDQSPAIVNRVQRFSPSGLPDVNVAKLYKDNGIVGLLRMGEDVAYQTVVWRLAQHIAKFHYSHRVKPRKFRERNLRNVFLEQSK